MYKMRSLYELLKYWEEHEKLFTRSYIDIATFSMSGKNYLIQYMQGIKSCSHCNEPRAAGISLTKIMLPYFL